MRAVERRSPVIYQAAMFDGRFAGFADFLILEDGPDGPRYRLRDTKLARSVKVEALLQLAAYADTLDRAGVPVAPEVELVLGDGVIGELPRSTNCYRSTCPAAPPLQRLLDDHLAGGTPVSWAGRGRPRLLPLPGVRRSRCARTTTCCSSRACGSASAPA